MKSTGMINDRLNGNKSYRSLRYLCLALLLFIAGTAISITPVQAANEGDNIPISIGDAPYPNDDASSDPPYLLYDDQQNPSIIALPDKNKWFVVWEDWRNWSTTGSDIYGRFINDDGTLCGDEIAISTASGNQTVPTAAYSSGDDNILIAWQDTRGATASGFLYYNILDISSLATDCSSGATLGSEIALDYTSIGGDSLISRKLPKAAYDTARDQFWLVWIESRDALQRIEEHAFGVSSGNTNWNFGDSNYVGYATIGTSTPVEIIRNIGTYDRTVRLISHSMTADEDVYVYEYFKNVNNVTIACDDSTSETMIVWEGVRGRATLTCTYEDTDENDVPSSGDAFFAELVLDEWDSGDGLVHIFSIFDKYIAQTVVHSQLIDASTKNCFYPAVGFDTTHRKFLVAWEDRDPRDGIGDGVHSKIFGQLIYSGGGLYGENIPISFQDTNDDGDQDQNVLDSNQTRPQVSLDSTNQRFFVTWQDGRNSQVSLENLDIFGQFIDSEGSLRGSNYAVCVESANQNNPVTAYNSGNHQFVTVWKDARNLNDTNSDIYGQRFTLGQPQLILLNEDDTPLIPPLLNFGSIQSGEAPTMSVKMKNTGDSTIHIDYVTPLAAPFAYVALPPELVSAGDGDTIDLVPGSSYKLYVRFSPTVDGTFIDDFTIQSDAANLTVNLQGVRVPSVPPVAGIRVTPSSIIFGSVTLGESRSMTLTFSNTGTVDVAIVGTDVPSTGFKVTGLSGTIKAGEDLVTLVTFTPDQPRSYSGYLRVYYDFGVAATMIYLSGLGEGGIIAEITPPDDVDFGNVAIGDTRSANLIFLNTGNVDLVITSIDLPGGAGFSVVGLPATIPAYGRLDAIAYFTPELPQAYTTVLRVLYDYGLATSEINLSGVGVYDVNSVIEVPDEVDFGSVNLGEVNNATLRFLNKGGVPVEITAIDLPAGAFLVDGLPAIIPAYGVLDVLVTFFPLVAKDYSETMRVLYAHGIPTSDIDFVGVGVNLSVPAVTLSSYSFDFGRVGLGSTSTVNLVLTNTGDVDVEITAFDLPSPYFVINGLSAGLLAEGQSKVVTIAFTPTVMADFASSLVILFDHDLPPAVIALAGTGAEIEIIPEVLLFPASDIGSSTVLEVALVNSSDHDLQVKGTLIGTLGTDAFSFYGVAAGDVVRSGGGKVVFYVTFQPPEPGYLEDYFFVSVGPVQSADTPSEEIDWGVSYTLPLIGIANADFAVTERDTFTADIDYDLSISASTRQAGQVFVLFSHDPFSAGGIYALDQSGTLQPFPYGSTFGWQSLWNVGSTYPGNDIDLNNIDFRQLGCTQCQGEAADSDGSFYFGDILIEVPNDDEFRSALDFKYMGGTLYMATYIKNSSGAGVFDFNQGLLEMQSLKINLLAGTWQVTSCYYDTDVVHAGLLVVTEPGNGQISAVWPPYNQTMVYSNEESAYVMTFNMGIYDYTYKITALTADSFTGSYTCIANGEIVADNLSVSGVRIK